MMKVITDYEQLVGKTIAFAHMAQFADQITLATTDGEVLMATFEYDYDGDNDSTEIRLFHYYQVISAIQENRYLQEELDELGIFNLEEWKAEAERKQKEQIEKSKKEQEERELKLLAELKSKYENN